MNLNSILKTGGKVNVLIRAKTPQLIGNQGFTENEPYTLIEKIAIDFTTSQEGVRSRSNGILVSYNDSVPNRITLHNVPLTEKICDLVFQSRQCLKKTYQCFISALQNTLILHHQIAYNIFVYDLNNNKVGYSNVTTDGKISSDLLNDNEKYLVFYEYAVEQQENIKMYNLQSPDRSYFTLDIFAQGNQNNNSSDIFIKIDTCALITNSNLVFNNGLNDVDLVFDIIKIEKDKNKNYLIIE